jgi:predicted house-cleaning noncanonical NTP pyrophosphatase (MazG superfamily)
MIKNDTVMTGRQRGKLVRDRIPEICVTNGQTPITRTAEPDEAARLLRAKLREEVAEFLESGDVGELADIYEVIREIAARSGADLEEARRRKAAERGGFALNIVWEGNQ